MRGTDTLVTIFTRSRRDDPKATGGIVDGAFRAWILTGCLALGLVALAACQAEPRRTGDVDQIRASGELRVIVRPGYLRAPPSGAGQVDELALLRQLAARLDVRVRLLECHRNDRIIPWLIEGLCPS